MLHAKVDVVQLPDDEQSKAPDDLNIWHLEYTVSTFSPTKLAHNDVILDCGAQASIFGNKKLLTNFRKTDCPIFIRGVNSKDKLLQVDTIAMFKDSFQVYYSP